MAKFSVQGINLSFDEEIADLRLNWKLAKQEFIKTGRRIHKFMIDYVKITATSNESNVHLHNEIDFNSMDLGMSAVVEIGDVERLKANTPWWYLINYGGAHPMAGRFLPGGFTDDGSHWIYDPGSNQGKIISEDARIPASNYIENTITFGESEYQRMLTLIGVK